MTIPASKTTHLEQGVFVVIRGIGVLIRGQPGTGKSSLALELLDRGHTLISDDVVQFEARHSTKSKIPINIIGSAPPMLQNLLAVRDIGVLDVTEIFSTDAVASEHRLDFIVELDADRVGISADFTNLYNETLMYGYKFPSQKIFAHTGRNIALIVETLIKNYILYKTGQDAGRKLIARQQQYL